MNVEYDYGIIQKLFIKLCFIFKQVNLEVIVSPNSSETIKLLAPKELYKVNEQVGAIQYGGIKYPLIRNNIKLDLQYVEVRLKGEFLRELEIYNNIYELFQQRDANDWLKYKLRYSKEDLVLARRVVRYIEKGFEKKFGKSYLTLGLDKTILDLPMQKNNSPITYNQSEAVANISELLTMNGYNVARTSNNQPTYHLTASKNGKSARLLVRHLQHDSAYRDSTIPYQVYKIDAFETLEQQTVGIKEIEFVVGYNFKDKCFACLDINQFFDKRSRVVHEREGQNSGCYNSWNLLNDYFV